MMTARVGRGGFHIVLQTKKGRASIALTGAGKSSHSSGISCSLIGLYNVLSGVDYVAVDGDHSCLVRQHGSHIEMVWKQGAVDTVIRLTKGEYRGLLKCASDQEDKPAA